MGEFKSQPYRRDFQGSFRITRPRSAGLQSAFLQTNSWNTPAEASATLTLTRLAHDGFHFLLQLGLIRL